MDKQRRGEADEHHGGTRNTAQGRGGREINRRELATARRLRRPWLTVAAGIGAEDDSGSDGRHERVREKRKDEAALVVEGIKRRWSEAGETEVADDGTEEEKKTVGDAGF